MTSTRYNLVITEHCRLAKIRNSDERVTIGLAISLNARNLSTLQFNILRLPFPSPVLPSPFIRARYMPLDFLV